MAYGVDGAPFGNRSFPPDVWLKTKEAIAHEVLREVREKAESVVPEVKVTTIVGEAGPIAAMTEASAWARLLVLGALTGELTRLFTESPADKLSSVVAVVAASPGWSSDRPVTPCCTTPGAR